MKHTWKKTAAFVLAMALVVGAAPANVGTGGFLGGTAITANAAEYNSEENVAVSDVQVGDILYAGSTIQQNGGQFWNAAIYIDDGLAGYAGANGGKYTVPCDTKVVAGGTSITLETLPSVTTDLSNATINVDVNNKSISVNADGRSISSTRYTVKYGATEENSTSEFPTEPGSYYAFITANTDTYSNYVGSAKSAAFAITATQTVTWTDISANKSQDDISITSSNVNFTDNNISGYESLITFTSTSGKIKKIEISCNGQNNMNVMETSSGWNECWGDGPLVWNGTAAESVTLSADMIDIRDFSQAVFTLEAKSDISDTTVTLDTDNQSVSVTRGNAFIPEDEYEVTYGTTAETATADFPTAPGKYYAFVTAKADSTYYTGIAQSEQFVVNGALADGEYKQTASKDGKYYTRFVFVKPKSEIEGKSKAKFTAHYNNDDYTFDTTKYYTGMTSNGIYYTLESRDSVMFVVTISSGSDISADLTCDIDFE